ncbi:hypothetical protein FIBSPDRAFT_242528 [Athelia psychrophila]|uniref:Uncharacterized protein n=1 Tax=Athelia psychrophila TaxID=1759441 RepID=A0A165Y5X1_9AGAM|nr:hypothetical protein FIBSPDRAFT_242528 [Fibularhizoctonia sp. CBS 109695]
MDVTCAQWTAGEKTQSRCSRRLTGAMRGFRMTWRALSLRRHSAESGGLVYGQTTVQNKTLRCRTYYLM